MAKLVADDPYQYEGTDGAWLEQERARLQIRVRWYKATAEDRRHLVLIGNEIARREKLRAI